MKPQRYRLFVSSPGDVQPERDRTQGVVDRLNAEMPEVELEVVRWEKSVYRATRDFQAQIASPADCDLVVCIFWARLGTPLPADYDRPDGSSRSGTEYEFESALTAAEEPEGPDVLVYRKTAPPPDDEFSRTAYRELENFWRRWFENEEGHLLAGFDNFRDTDEFVERLERHLRLWLAERKRAEWDIAQQGSPFRGLEAFDESHAAVFFGRRREIERARARLMAAAESGWASLILIGPSGSGKSSLMRAGLLPRLSVPGSTSPLVERWRKLVMTPSYLGTDPAAELARALLDEQVLPELADQVDASRLATQLADNPRKALLPVHSALDACALHTGEAEGYRTPPITGLLLAIDQLEEVFSLDAAAREQFLHILECLARSDRIWLLATLRSDFYTRFHEDPRLLRIREAGRVLDLPPPSSADVRQMIEGAARTAGLELEDDGERSLAELLEADAREPGSLPMLQFTLQSLFDRRDREQGLLRLADYDALGGAPGALATRAEEIVAGLGESGAEALPHLIWKLAELSDTGDTTPRARSVGREELEAVPGGAALVEAMLGSRLLLAWSDPEGVTRIRVAHERLLTEWPRVTAILERIRDDLRVRARSEQARRLWLEAPESERSGRLLRGLALGEARQLEQRWGAQLPESLRDYIQASESAHQARRRRRIGAVAGVMVVLGGLAGAAGWFAISADQARQEAEQVIELQREVFEASDPGALAGRVVEALRTAARDVEADGDSEQIVDSVIAEVAPADHFRELLGEQFLVPARERMEEELADQPVVHARLQVTLADIYRGWAQYDTAQELIQTAHATLADELGPEARPTLEARGVQAKTYHDLARYEDALAAWEELREIHTRLDGPDHPRTLDATHHELSARIRLQQMDRSEALAEELVTARREHQEEDHPDLTRALHMQAMVYFQMEAHDIAREIQEQVLERSMAHHGQDHSRTLTAMNNLANTLRALGEEENATELREEVLERSLATLGHEHPDTVRARSNLAVSHALAGRFSEAREQLEQAVEGSRRLHGEDHPHTIDYTGNLGHLLYDMGHYEEARETLEGVVADYAAQHGELHPSVLTFQDVLADVHEALDEEDQALEIRRGLVEARREARGEDHHLTLDAQFEKARLLCLTGRHDAAQEVLAPAFEIAASELEDDDLLLVDLVRALAYVAMQRGEEERARELRADYLQDLPESVTESFEDDPSRPACE